jgi:oxygen-independent coproporphyrinogen-3 oxidase
LPLYRGMKPTPHQLLVREMILQLKTGRLDTAYFQDKFGVGVLDHWRAEFQQHADDEYLTLSDREVKLTRKGLLRVDSLLPAFFEPEHRGVRYT